MVTKIFILYFYCKFHKTIKIVSFPNQIFFFNLRTVMIWKTHENCLMEFWIIMFLTVYFLPSTYSSKRENTSDDGWWIVQRTVWPLCTSIFKHCMTLDAMKESRPEVGSSQNIRGGFIRSLNSNSNGSGKL